MVINFKKSSQKLLGILNNVFYLSGLIWTDFLSMTLLWITLRREVPGLRFEIMFHVLAWPFPLVLSLLGLLPQVGFSLGFAWLPKPYTFRSLFTLFRCWFDQSEKGYSSWILALIWEWIGVIICFLVYIILGVLAIWYRCKTGSWQSKPAQVSNIFFEFQ